MLAHPSLHCQQHPVPRPQNREGLLLPHSQQVLPIAQESHQVHATHQGGIASQHGTNPFHQDHLRKDEEDGPRVHSDQTLNQSAKKFYKISKSASKSHETLVDWVK